MDKIKEKRPKFKFSQASIITIVTAVIFLTGYLYDQGNLESYKLTDQYFPRDFQFYLVKTFYVLMFFISDIFKRLNEYPFIFMYLSFAFAISTLIGLLLLKNKKIKCWHIKAAKQVKAVSQYKYFDLTFFPAFIFIFGSLAPYFAIIIIAALCFPLWGGYLMGQHNAKQAMEAYKGCDTKKLHKKYNCVFIMKNEKSILYSGMFIAKSNTHIALWNGTHANVYPLKVEEHILVK